MYIFSKLCTFQWSKKKHTVVCFLKLTFYKVIVISTAVQVSLKKACNSTTQIVCTDRKYKAKIKLTLYQTVTSVFTPDYVMLVCVRVLCKLVGFLLTPKQITLLNKSSSTCLYISKQWLLFQWRLKVYVTSVPQCTFVGKRDSITAHM